MGARRHGQEGGGGTCPLWKCCEVFLCISSYSKTLTGRIIYALFSQPVVSFWWLCRPDPHQDPFLDPCWGIFVPRPLICLPLEKILLAPMTRL